MPGATRNPELGANHEIVASRVFDAPRELVFEVWTVAEHFARWFGPRGVELAFCEIDARPGGILHFCHQFEGGTRLWVKGVFQEVVAPERLVFTVGFVDAEGRPARHPMLPDWPLDAAIETTVLLEAARGGTNVTVKQRIKPAEAAVIEAVVHERRLARQGWTEVFDRLGEHLETAKGGTERAR